jgi:hypothetical protein
VAEALHLTGKLEWRSRWCKAAPTNNGAERNVYRCPVLRYCGRLPSFFSYQHESPIFQGYPEPKIRNESMRDTLSKPELLITSVPADKTSDDSDVLVFDSLCKSVFLLLECLLAWQRLEWRAAHLASLGCSPCIAWTGRCAHLGFSFGGDSDFLGLFLCVASTILAFSLWGVYQLQPKV